MTFLLTYVALNIADVALDRETFEFTVSGKISNEKWDKFNEIFLTWIISSDLGSRKLNSFVLRNMRNESVKGLVIKNTKTINFLPLKVHEKFPNLIAYDASNCSVKFLLPEYFFKLEKLELLNLSNNQIDNIGTEVFEALVSLRFLLLNNNKIQYSVPHTFKNLIKLEMLDLNFNQIKNYVDKNLEPLV